MRGWSTRELVTTGRLRALWGVAEMTLGGVAACFETALRGPGDERDRHARRAHGYRFVPRRGAVLTVRW